MRRVYGLALLINMLKRGLSLNTSPNAGLTLLHDSSRIRVYWKTSNVFVYERDERKRKDNGRLASKAVDCLVPSGWCIVTPLNTRTEGLVFAMRGDSEWQSWKGPKFANGVYHCLIDGLYAPSQPVASTSVRELQRSASGSSASGVISLLEISVPLSLSVEEVSASLGLPSRIVQISKTSTALALVDVVADVDELHVARRNGILPRPTPAKFLKFMRRDALRHSRLLSADSGEKEEEEVFSSDTERSKAEFCGLSLELSRGALAPRASSAALVDEALVELQKMENPSEDLGVLDAGCGCGALLLSLLHRAGEKRIKGLGIDLDPEALSAARQNAISLGISRRSFFAEQNFGRLHESDFATTAAADGAFPRGFDCVISNPPFLSSRAAVDRITQESQLALVAGSTGMKCYVEIVSSIARAASAAEGLGLFRPGCVLLLQLPGGEKSADTVKAALLEAKAIAPESGSGEQQQLQSPIVWERIALDSKGVRRVAVLRITQGARRVSPSGV